MRFDRRMQPFSISHPSGVDEIVVYDATPENIPSIIGFVRQRSTAIVLPEFAGSMHDHGFMVSYRDISVGAVEEFLATFGVEFVPKYRGRSAE